MSRCVHVYVGVSGRVCVWVCPCMGVGVSMYVWVCGCVHVCMGVWVCSCMCVWGVGGGVCVGVHVCVCMCNMCVGGSNVYIESSKKKRNLHLFHGCHENLLQQ